MRDQGLTELMELSARLGSQPLLVRGNTGNTSIKVDTLWIKASGKRLAKAAGEEMFAPVNLQGVEHFISQASAWLDGPRLTPAGLTPSIETAMHLVLPHRVVIHLHSVSRQGPRAAQSRPDQTLGG
jgi:rhamnose utilization protein RhaD (predicted bifunctional aldolase and dehydrogenase)